MQKKQAHPSPILNVTGRILEPREEDGLAGCRIARPERDRGELAPSLPVPTLTLSLIIGSEAPPTSPF